MTFGYAGALASAILGGATATEDPDLTAVYARRRAEIAVDQAWERNDSQPEWALWHLCALMNRHAPVYMPRDKIIVGPMHPGAVWPL